MSTQDREKLLDKVKKLMAIANDSGASANEVEVALKKANRLLVSHNLSMADVAISEIENDITETNPQDIYFGSVMSEGQWEPLLMEVLCEANLCHSLKYVAKYKSDGYMSIIGTKENVIVVKYLYQVACDKLRAASKIAYNKHRKEVLDEYKPQGFSENELLKMKVLGRRMVWIRNFLKGGVVGLKSKFAAEKKQMQQDDQLGQKFGLMLVSNRQAIQNFIDNKHKDVKVSSAPMNINPENAAFQIGVEEGKNTTLNQALVSKNDNQLALTSCQQ